MALTTERGGPRASDPPAVCLVTETESACRSCQRTRTIDSLNISYGQLQVGASWRAAIRQSEGRLTSGSIAIFLSRARCKLCQVASGLGSAAHLTSLDWRVLNRSSGLLHRDFCCRYFLKAKTSQIHRSFFDKFPVCQGMFLEQLETSLQHPVVRCGSSMLEFRAHLEKVRWCFPVPRSQNVQLGDFTFLIL